MLSKLYLLWCLLTLPLHTPYSGEDAKLLARLLYSECRGESYEGQLMVAQCVVDRLEYGLWGDSIEEVILSDGQFAKPGKLTDELLHVAMDVLKHGIRPVSDVKILFFRVTNTTANWHATYLCHVGKHAFYGE